MRELVIKIIICISMIFLVGCQSQKVFAPVSSATIEPLPRKGIYRVQANETLYAIAWRYGLDYRYIAKRNNISAPYQIYQGQLIYLKGKRPPLTMTPQQPVQKKEPFKKTIIEREPTAAVSAWLRPARGPLISRFSGSNKGVNIGGRLGDSVYATAKGKVVYSGNGIRGYGNLIIIKHNSIYLTAYAYNDKILVKEGQWVKAGQKIAEMGYGGARQIMLHFEIRRGGRPVDPLKYI